MKKKVKTIINSRKNKQLYKEGNKIKMVMANIYCVLYTKYYSKSFFFFKDFFIYLSERVGGAKAGRMAGRGRKRSRLHAEQGAPCGT